MDRLSISSAGNLGAGCQGLANLKRRVLRSEEEEFAQMLGGGEAAANKADVQTQSEAVAANVPASALAKRIWRRTCPP